MKPINEKLAAVLLPILPVGLLLWSGGSLSSAHFLTIIVLSLGLTSPLIAACPSWMSLLW